MRFGLRLPSYAWPDLTYDQLKGFRAYCRHAEESGFESLWAIDHLFVTPALYGVSWLDPIAVLSYAAAATEKAQLGTGILVLPLRHPVLVAKEVATLDFLSGGRFIFGVGAGWAENEFEALGVPLAERGARTDEAVEIIRRLLSEPDVSFQGRFYRLSHVTIDPRPPRLPPIWVAGGSLGHAPETPDKPYIAPSVIKRVAKADAWISRSSGSDASMVKADWEVICEYLRQVGRDPSTLLFAHTQFVHISEKATHQEAIEEQGPHFAGVMGTHRTFEDLSASYLMGTIEEIQRRIDDLRSAGVQYLVLNPVTDDLKQIDLLAKYVVSQFP